MFVCFKFMYKQVPPINVEVYIIIFIKNRKWEFIEEEDLSIYYTYLVLEDSIHIYIYIKLWR